MKINFDIIENYAINYNGKHIDLHNNFYFVGFEYNIGHREFKMTWTKSTGSWVSENEISGLILVHKLVTYLSISGQDEKSNFDDDSCLGEISFFPSELRYMNENIIPQSKPNPGDDILYYFENGQLIRINCDEVCAIII